MDADKKIKIVLSRKIDFPELDGSMITTTSNCLIIDENKESKKIEKYNCKQNYV